MHTIDEKLEWPMEHFVNVQSILTWCRKWGNPSIKPNIEVVDDVSGNRGSGQPRTPPLLIIPRVLVEEVVVPEFEKEGRFRGVKHGKHCES